LIDRELLLDSVARVEKAILDVQLRWSRVDGDGATR
jgi:hypothetical protein